MQVLRKIWIWFLMLSKRLYKKPSFLLILLLIPVAVFAYGKVAEEDSGIVTIVVSAEDPQDPIAAQIMSDLENSSPLMRFVLCDSVSQAEEMVHMYQADAAWILPAQMGERIQAFINADRSRPPIVRVIVREKNVAMMLTSEKLSGVMFKHCARAYYLHYLRDKADVLDVYTDEELLAFYDEAIIGDQLFSFTNTEGKSQSGQQYNYLLTPMRGLLGVIIVLCGLATAMYYVKDDSAGLFAYLPENKRFLAEMGYQTVSLLNICTVVFLSVSLLGLSVGFGRELLVMIGYMVCSLSFCLLVRACCNSLRGLGTAMVLLVVLMIAICPVFYDFALLRDFQLFLPPTYYVNAAYNDSYMLYMWLYTGICMLLYWVIEKLRKI